MLDRTLTKTVLSLEEEAFIKRHNMRFCVNCDKMFTPACFILFPFFVKVQLECFKPRKKRSYSYDK
jgi:hypothetical protein